MKGHSRPQFIIYLKIMTELSSLDILILGTAFVFLAPPFLSKLATKQCREFKFLLISGGCESHNSGIQSLVATFGGLRVPQIRPLVTSHLVQSLSDRCPNYARAPPHFCPDACQALSKQ